MLNLFGVKLEHINPAILILDKIEKIGVDGVISELKDLPLTIAAINAIQLFLTEEKNRELSFFDCYANQNQEIQEGLAEVRELQSYLEFLYIGNQCVFNPFLARGLEIYTGTIYEIFLMNQMMKSSIGSGGRYDNAIGGFLGTNENFATVGISFGLDVIYTILSQVKISNIDGNQIDYYVVPLTRKQEALLVAKDLRKKGYKVEIEMRINKVGKALEKANKENVQNVVIIGENEVQQNQITIKDMTTGKESVEAYTFH
ncbi:ATP phosphoribosyltransferase regulatory subunit [Paraliobacillus ryukyuensis]|uniref:histidine--tRNA ligase n=1 Tax=Paraliobacillus ryukyuensis TaxID=200904 RepID=A0A366EDF9_9BACI|nr:anticodon tRNA-binding protein [Paraliobacillus ryukyuensis]